MKLLVYWFIGILRYWYIGIIICYLCGVTGNKLQINTRCANALAIRDIIHGRQGPTKSHATAHLAAGLATTASGAVSVLDETKVALLCQETGLNKALLLLGSHVLSLGDNASVLVHHQGRLGKTSAGLLCSSVPNLGTGSDINFVCHYKIK